MYLVLIFIAYSFGVIDGVLFVHVYTVILILMYLFQILSFVGEGNALSAEVCMSVCCLSVHLLVCIYSCMFVLPSVHPSVC